MAGHKGRSRAPDHDEPGAGRPARKAAKDRSDTLAWWWATQGVDPLPGRAAPEPPKPEPGAAPPRKESGKVAKPAAAPGTPPPRAAYAPALHPGRAPGLDRRSQQRLSRGLFPIAAELDLHGMRRHEARDALQAFLAACQGSERRCVRVITGRGRTGDEDSGVLRDLVPRWLNEPPNRQRVLSFDVTQPRHGGAGALYVLLRRRG